MLGKVAFELKSKEVYEYINFVRGKQKSLIKDKGSI